MPSIIQPIKREIQTSVVEYHGKVVKVKSYLDLGSTKSYRTVAD